MADIAANEVAKGYVSISPSLDGFRKELAREVEQAVGAIGKAAGQDFGRDFAAGASRDLDRLGRDADKVAGRFSAMGSKVAASLKRMAAVGATAAAGLTVAFGVKAVRAASDLGESMNAVDVTFGEAADGIKALGDQAVKTTGLSKTQFASLAVQFSNFAETVAGEGGDVVGVMDELTVRAADFASVMNLDVAEAATLFQSGLAGETEPLRRYGIDLSAAAVEAYALSEGISDGTGELTEQEKVLARYGLLMESTSKVTGDFANTQDSLANQTRMAKANFENLAAAAGEALLPIAEAIMPRMNDAMEDLGLWFEGNMPSIQERTREWGEALGGLMDKVQENWPDIKETLSETAATIKEEWPDIKDLFLTLADAFERMAPAIETLWDAFNSLPDGVRDTLAMLAVIGLTLKPLAGVVGAVGGSSAAATVAAWLGATSAGVAAGVAGGAALGTLGAAKGYEQAQEQGATPGALNNATSVPGGGVLWTETVPTPEDLEKTKARASWMPAWLYKVVYEEEKPESQYMNLLEPTDWGPSLENMLEGLKIWGGQVWESVTTTFSGFASTVNETLSGMWENVSNWFSSMGENISTTASGIWANVTGWFSSTSESVSATVSGMWETVTGWFGSLGTSISTTVSGIWAGVTGAFDSIATSVGNTVSGMWQNVTGWFSSLGTKIGEIFNGIVASVTDIWGDIGNVVKGPVNELFGWLNRNIITKLNSVVDRFSESERLNIGLLPTFHSGGYTGDQIFSREGLALVRNDEFVLNPKATAEHRELAEALNDGKGREYLADVARAGAMGYGVGPIGDIISAGWKALTDVLARGARAAVDFIVNPAFDMVERNFGGNYTADLSIGFMRKAVDVLKDWATGHDASSAGYDGPIQSGNFTRPVNGVVTSEFGPRWGAFHAGIDIGAPMGAAIRAIADGKAVSTTGMGWNGGYGNMVTLDHGRGFSTRYAHASALSVALGQIVKAGQQIAAVGSTGDSTGPHLHFETRRNGVAVNPRSVMAFDSGGFLPPGLSMAFNGTGRPEPVLTDKQWKAIREGGGNTYTFNVAATQVPTEEAMLGALRRTDAIYGRLL